MSGRDIVHRMNDRIRRKNYMRNFCVLYHTNHNYYRYPTQSLGAILHLFQSNYSYFVFNAHLVLFTVYVL